MDPRDLSPQERRALWLKVLAERRAGKTLVKLAEELKISRERVRQLEVRGRELEIMNASNDPKYELSVRVRNCLLNEGCQITPEAVAAHFKSTYELLRVPNLGRRSVLQIQEWLIRHGQKPLEMENYW